MPPFRNPFGRRPQPPNDPIPGQGEDTPAAAPNGQAKAPQRSDLTNSRTSSALSIKANKDEPNEFKLSVVNDSGVYLPPSPPEKKSFWHRSATSSSSSNHRSMLSENEPFSISRESFDSYRRSFDISARSPVLPAETNPPRQSLDSRTSRMPRSAINGSGRFARPQPTDEEGFEDIGLNDEAKPKKRGIFSRFADSADPSASDDSSRPSSSHRGFHLPGRKRGQSGQGAELGNINKPATNADDDGVIR
ncbi:hypothetical protein LPUS_04947 [Lasallia pustulata]|uniref:Uncharacterized protein n=1 Tax=Lasallia pustulata TaxID=136370 RepID=A0A1W5CXV0_9LECA|nr:hypothetical protein LPUS_04947 [Lasallia pustulata]